jgi:hypothetical protein
MTYNFVKAHPSLEVSPAMQVGVVDRLWSYEDVIGLLETSEPSAAEIGKRRYDARKSG